ncbi:hypothetical protein GQ602_005590 [Ophiocordyceps camponoti-floridani]|uniref:Uncharacterized protein n=1 Tax=Ophiocordyceps camponoti-floridani TaxID=2030778 RepID=A0A8H4VC41_9HYPO|nr:hypothetical protein GQ602_005590 [Ophiocordyceps camponoti-floridani]
MKKDEKYWNDYRREQERRADLPHNKAKLKKWHKELQAIPGYKENFIKNQNRMKSYARKQAAAIEAEKQRTERQSEQQELQQRRKMISANAQRRYSNRNKPFWQRESESKMKKRLGIEDNSMTDQGSSAGPSLGSRAKSPDMRSGRAQFKGTRGISGRQIEAQLRKGVSATMQSIQQAKKAYNGYVGRYQVGQRGRGRGMGMDMGRGKRSATQDMMDNKKEVELVLRDETVLHKRMEEKDISREQYHAQAAREYRQTGEMRHHVQRKTRFINEQIKDNERWERRRRIEEKEREARERRENWEREWRESQVPVYKKVWNYLTGTGNSS